MEVKLIDHMGDDIRVVNAARVSFAKESEWEVTWENSLISRDFSGMPFQEPVNHLSKQDQKLIKYLAKHGHWTPFSHIQITMREKVPIFVARQRFKHMVGFTYNEVSRRYVDDAPEFYTPDVWRSRPDGGLKQGSGSDVVELLAWDTETDTQTRPFPKWFGGDGRPKAVYEKFIRMVEELYNEMIMSGIAPEQARMVLPQSLYTEYYVTGSLAAWARAYKLRIDSHAQKEIQDLAKMWNREISKLDDLKYSWKALTDE